MEFLLSSRATDVKTILEIGYIAHQVCRPTQSQMSFVQVFVGVVNDCGSQVELRLWVTGVCVKDTGAAAACQFPSFAAGVVEEGGDTEVLANL